MSAPMEIDNTPVPGLVAAVAAAVEAAASEDLIQPLFTETVVDAAADEDADDAAADADDAAADADNAAADADDADADADDDATTESSVSEQGLNPAPSEMRQWIDEIDNIEYHYRHDDDDRGYNFFRDNAGNTLMIQEFDVKGERFFNINREMIMKQSEFFSLYDAVKTPDGVNATIFGQKLLRSCSTDLLVEALTILADDNSSETSSEASSEASSEEEPQPSPIPTKGDADAIQRFLFSCFLVLIFLKFFGCIIKFA